MIQKIFLKIKTTVNKYIPFYHLVDEVHSVTLLLHWLGQRKLRIQILETVLTHYFS